MRTRMLWFVAAVSAGGCGSAIQIPADRAAAVPVGSTPAAVANQLGARGTLLFSDVREGHRIDGVAYRVGYHRMPHVFLYTDGRLTRICEWDGQGTNTMVPGVGLQDLCGFAGTLRPDALLEAEAALLVAPGVAVVPDSPLLPSQPYPGNDEDRAMSAGFMPLIIIAAPIWIPVVTVGKLTARTAADVPLGGSAAEVDRAMGKPARMWPEAADNPGEWRRYDRPDGDDPWANGEQFYVLFRGGRAVATFGPGLVSRLGY